MTDFDEYLRQGEPDKSGKAKAWKTAIGLQKVDGLEPSKYLIETARKNIEGDITIDEVKLRIDEYYKQYPTTKKEDRTEEADKVSARITEILGEKSFSFSPIEYINIHQRLFHDIYEDAGKIRDYNITKKEWVLNGETILYGSADNLKETLEYDFEKERQFNYKGLTQKETIEHIAHFISYLWQIHIFGEGNTRATAIFLIKYLRTFGFEVNNQLFADYSWYFRNALDRAIYKDYTRNIHANYEFLYRFFENLLLGETHILKNREMHIFYKKETSAPHDPLYDPVNDPVKSGILQHLKTNPHATYKELSLNIKVSTSTIKRHIQLLKKAGILERIGSDKTGYWKIKI